MLPSSNSAFSGDGEGVFLVTHADGDEGADEAEEGVEGEGEEGVPGLEGGVESADNEDEDGDESVGGGDVVGAFVALGGIDDPSFATEADAFVGDVEEEENGGPGDGVGEPGGGPEGESAC